MADSVDDLSEQSRREVLAYYARYAEEARLASGSSLLEFERSKEILARVLPAAPARVLDVGGAAGAYSFWLAGQGYEVHLVDLSPRLVEEARKRGPLKSFTVGDARALAAPDAWADAVLLMGPLYHLTEADDRLRALREAFRVLAPGGVVAAAAISRYASSLDGMARNLALDPEFVAIRDRDLADGQHRNADDHPDYFTTAYFHRPDDLREELEAAGFRDVRVLGVEGPGWILSDLKARWEDEAAREVVLATARVLEDAAAIVGASAHLLGIGWKP